MKKINGLLAVMGVIAGLALLSHKAKAATEYKCPHCGVVSTNWDELVSHAQEVHPGERLPIRGQW